MKVFSALNNRENDKLTVSKDDENEDNKDGNEHSDNNDDDNARHKLITCANRGHVS